MLNVNTKSTVLLFDARPIEVLSKQGPVKSIKDLVP